MMRFLDYASAALIVAICLLGAGAATVQAQEPRFITIGTGGVTGIYYPAGGAICRLVNRGRARHGIRCSVEATGGSVDNINIVRAGALDFGIVQSDVQHQARRGKGPFKDESAFRRLRSVFSLHAEPLTILARADAGIATVIDLKGKRVNIGNPGSGQRAAMAALLKAKRWSMDDFALASELGSAEQAQALIDDQIDAAVFTVAHPSGTIQSLTALIDTVLIKVTGGAVRRLLRKPFYAKAVIPGGTYRGAADEDVRTFGVRATLVTTADVPDDVVYEVIKAVFEHLDEFRPLHPAFAPLVAEEMAHEALSAPLHPGARLFYEEAGLQ